MPLSNERLEELEREYFDQLYYYLKSIEQRMMCGLASKNNIKDDWWAQFIRGAEKRQVSDFARGAERIFYWLLTTLWTPNSSPIGSDMFFEAHNAFVHIDVKTANFKNTSDYLGKVAIGRNQTSYDADKTATGLNTRVNPNLPQYYHRGTEKEKPCLTFTIQVIHDAKTLDIIAILLICVPNGQLYGVYGNRIVGGGKSKDESMRYEYKNAPVFETIYGHPYRVKFLYFNEQRELLKQQITTKVEL